MKIQLVRDPRYKARGGCHYGIQFDENDQAEVDEKLVGSLLDAGKVIDKTETKKAKAKIVINKV